MRTLDFTSLQSLLSTLLGLAVITLIGVGIRLLLMQTMQQRRERENRQINERLRTLIAAYKTLGGSFTGNLAVDPTHLRDLKRASMAVPPEAQAALDAKDRAKEGAKDGAIGAIEGANQDAIEGANQGTNHGTNQAAHAVVPAPAETGETASNDRARRIRDAVEGALADIILLGTEEQVRLAVKAAQEMTQGRPVHTAALVVSLRTFIRSVLNLDAMPGDLAIPEQGPARPSSGAAKAKDGGGEGKGGGKDGGGMGAAGGMGGAAGMGGTASGASTHHDDEDAHHA